MKASRSAKKSLVLRMRASWITLVTSPRLNIPPRPAVFKQLSVQPTVRFGQTS